MPIKRCKNKVVIRGKLSTVGRQDIKTMNIKIPTALMDAVLAHYNPESHQALFFALMLDAARVIDLKNEDILYLDKFFDKYGPPS